MNVLLADHGIKDPTIYNEINTLLLYFKIVQLLGTLVGLIVTLSQRINFACTTIALTFYRIDQSLLELIGFL